MLLRCRMVAFDGAYSQGKRGPNHWHYFLSAGRMLISISNSLPKRCYYWRLMVIDHLLSVKDTFPLGSLGYSHDSLFVHPNDYRGPEAGYKRGLRSYMMVLHYPFCTSWNTSKPTNSKISLFLDRLNQGHGVRRVGPKYHAL